MCSFLFLPKTLAQIAPLLPFLSIHLSKMDSSVRECWYTRVFLILLPLQKDQLWIRHGSFHSSQPSFKIEPFGRPHQPPDAGPTELRLHRPKAEGVSRARTCACLTDCRACCSTVWKHERVTEPKLCTGVIVIVARR